MRLPAQRPFICLAATTALLAACASIEDTPPATTIGRLDSTQRRS